MSPKVKVLVHQLLRLVGDIEIISTTGMGFDASAFYDTSTMKEANMCVLRQVSRWEMIGEYRNETPRQGENR